MVDETSDRESGCGSEKQNNELKVSKYWLLSLLLIIVFLGYFGNLNTMGYVKDVVLL